MKGYRKFIIIFSALFILYLVAELNKPKPIDWTVTLSRSDKIPYGGFIVYNQLKDFFSNATIQSYRRPVYDQLNNSDEQNTAYLIISPTFNPSMNDLEEMKDYVEQGNYVLISAGNFSKAFLDSFKLQTDLRISIINKDSTSINLVNPLLKASKDYTFLSSTIDQFFSKIDTTASTVLGVNDRKQPNFVKIGYGDGAFLVHAMPLCFSNYFMLFANNESYTSKALSYLPADVDRIYWDEYYKLGPEGAETPLRLFLSNNYLLWALRLALAGLLIYVLFEMKRKQRVIPVITPLRNSTLDFIKTVSNVYYNQKDNDSIAHKKITYFLEFIRQRFYLSTNLLDENFAEQLARKSGVNRREINGLIQLLTDAQSGYAITDRLLVQLDQDIDNFYKQVL